MLIALAIVFATFVLVCAVFSAVLIARKLGPICKRKVVAMRAKFNLSAKNFTLAIGLKPTCDTLLGVEYKRIFRPFPLYDSILDKEEQPTTSNVHKEKKVAKSFAQGVRFSAIAERGKVTKKHRKHKHQYGVPKVFKGVLLGVVNDMYLIKCFASNKDCFTSDAPFACISKHTNVVFSIYVQEHKKWDHYIKTFDIICKNLSPELREVLLRLTVQIDIKRQLCANNCNSYECDVAGYQSIDQVFDLMDSVLDTQHLPKVFGSIIMHRLQPSSKLLMVYDVKSSQSDKALFM